MEKCCKYSYMYCQVVIECRIHSAIAISNALRAGHNVV